MIKNNSIDKEKVHLLEEQVEALNKEKRAILDAIEFAANVGNFRISLNKIDSPEIILKETTSRVKQVLDFKALSFYLVNEKDSNFYQEYTEPEEYSNYLDNEINHLIEDKTFFWALTRNKPVIISSQDKKEQIILHTMTTSSRTRGLFIGILTPLREEITDLSLFLFSITIITCSNALESFELYRQIRERNEMLKENILKLESSQKKLKESEEKYRALFDQAGNSIILYDMETRKAVEFNDNALELLGFTRQEFKKLKIEDYEVDKTVKEIQHRITKFCIKGSYSYETRYKRKDGRLRDVTVNNKCIHIHGKTYIIALLTDITERKRSEAERKSLELQLVHAQKMESIGTLAGGIAHDFNNILGIILGYAELALLEVPDQEDMIHQNLQQLINAVDRAKNLVKQILTFSRQGDESPKSIEINPIIKEILLMLRSTLPTTIEIKHSIPRESLSIMGSPTQIHQILMNLCTNAAQAMRGKKGVLTIELKKVTSPIDVSYMQLTVSDTGEGISPDIQERVFEPYFTTKESSEGTGLGLAVVHGIVKRHNGDIAIDSQIGKGTTVKVKIPLVEMEIKPEEVVRESIPTGNENILLVDDEEALLGTYQQILERLNYSVITADSSIKALEIFRKTPSQIDLVICDMTMPELTGIQLAGELLNLRPEIPIILCTGFSEFIDAQKAKAVGIKEFLMKPVNKRILANTIRRVLNKEN